MDEDENAPLDRETSLQLLDDALHEAWRSGVTFHELLLFLRDRMQKIGDAEIGDAKIQ